MRRTFIVVSFIVLVCGTGGVAGLLGYREVDSDIGELREIVAGQDARIAQLERRGDELHSGCRSTIDDLAARVARLEASARGVEPSAAPAGAMNAADIGARVRRALDELRTVNGSQPVAIRDALSELVRSGDAAVPEITAFLDSGFDRSIGGRLEMRGKEVANYPTLRLVLFDALRQIGTPGAKESSAIALGASELATDIEAIWMYWTGGRDTPDPVVAAGLSRLASSVLRKVAATGFDELEFDSDYGAAPSLVSWIRAHGTSEDAPAIESLLGRGLPKDPMAVDAYFAAFAALVRIGPERAAVVASAIIGGSPRGRSQLMAMTERAYSVPAQSQARYFEALFCKDGVDAALRSELYARIPGPHPADRKADVEPLIRFLESRTSEETDAETRASAERALRRFRDDLARLKN